MLKVGWGKAPLLFPDDLGLFGFGPGGGRGIAVPSGGPDHDVLEARALWIEGGGTHLLVVSVDLVAGSWLVQRGLAAALAARGVTLPVDHIMVVGTHTHSGPGHFLGNLYDVLGHWPLGTRVDVVDLIVAAGLEASLAARGSAVESRVGVARSTLWSAGRNRSLRAFCANFREMRQWFDVIGVAPPADATPEEAAIDPRLTAVAFVTEAGRPNGSWATWCCHAATLPRGALRPYHRDWPGVAVDVIDREVGCSMIHQGANGDVTSLPSGRVTTAQPLARVTHLGQRIAQTWRETIALAQAAAEEVELEVASTRLVPSVAGLPRFEIGAPVILGSEEALPGPTVRIFGEARTLPFRRGAQGPKLPALGPLQYVARALTGLAPSPEHPMWLVRLGSHVFFASPFEQTTVAARSVESALVARFQERRGLTVTAGPIGLAGDYAGYVTTAPEYHLQHYEGAHTLYGPGQLEALTRQWCDLV